MLDFDLLSVFVDAGGDGGRPLAVFLDGEAVEAEERAPIARRLGVDRTAFVDDRHRGRLRIHSPEAELPVCGRSLVGTAWLLAVSGLATEVVRVPAGRVETWREDDSAWIRADPDWGRRFAAVELDSPVAVDLAGPPGAGTDPVHLWAWEDRENGVIRSHSVPSDRPAPGDWAIGLATLALARPIGRRVTIRHGSSLIEARPGPRDTVELGGRVAVVTATDYETFKPAGS